MKLFGTQKPHLEESKTILEDRLRCKLEARESTYHGGEYFILNSQENEFLLKRNHDPLEGGKIFEAKASEFPIILYISKTNIPEIDKLLKPDFVLIQ